jgi:hypothetical protein
MPELREIGMEDVLDRHLGQVSAPEELWRRVQSGVRPQRSRPVSRRLIWSMAAALVAGGAAWALHPRPGAEIQSANAVEIRQWVKTNAGLDVPLRDSSAVRLIGAHVTNRVNETAAAEIAYRAGDRDAILAVSKSPVDTDTHLAAVGEAHSGAKQISWTMGRQSFTVACDDPDQAHAACLLCHS